MTLVITHYRLKHGLAAMLKIYYEHEYFHHECGFHFSLHGLAGYIGNPMYMKPPVIVTGGPFFSLSGTGASTDGVPINPNAIMHISLTLTPLTLRHCVCV